VSGGLRGGLLPDEDAVAYPSTRREVVIPAAPPPPSKAVGDVGRHLQAVKDLREVPRELEGRLAARFNDGTFQARWDEIVIEAEAAGADGNQALGIAARELMIDFVELLRAVLFEREKAAFEQMRNGGQTR
jgi:hypothetical protein